MEKREIIKFEVVPNAAMSTLYDIVCLCNDGSLWIHTVGLDEPWQQIADIPQDIPN